MRLFRRGKTGGDDLRPEDRAVLQQLVAAGATLEEPRHGLFFLYFGSGEAAAAAAEGAAERSFECSVREPLPDDPDRWTLVCEQHSIVLLPRAVAELSAFFRGLAERHGGTYDGWEASV